MRKFVAILYFIGLILFPLVVIILAINPVVRWIAIVISVFNLLVYIRKNYKIRHRHYDGVLEVWEDDARMIHQLEILTPPEELSRKTRMTLLIKKVHLTLPDGDPNREIA